MTNHGTGRSFFSLLFGLTVGTAIGLLIAPRKGEETRETVLNWLKDYRVKGEEVVNKWREKFPEYKEKITTMRKHGTNTKKETVKT